MSPHQLRCLSRSWHTLVVPAGNTLSGTATLAGRGSTLPNLTDIVWQQLPVRLLHRASPNKSHDKLATTSASLVLSLLLLLLFWSGSCNSCSLAEACRVLP